MESRREFIKKATLLTGAAGFMGTLPESIQKALAINPAPGSTYKDAEHVVVLMQENRSFDHAYGALKGVRGFNDPRAIKLPNDNLVWLQKNAFGETHVPFRLNMRESNATWMGSLPHSWTNQVDARNRGQYDNWLIAKQPGHPEYQKMPLTLGYYNREDIPFYYALADAFTVCDQNFCSALTGTTPNRLYLWSGTLRATPDSESHANVLNGDVTDDNEASWKTFPERLEENDISWRVYQNELSIRTGFVGEEEEWLANFTDSPLEWFSQYNVRFHTGYQKYLRKTLEDLKSEIQKLKNQYRSTEKNTEVAYGLEKNLEEKGLLYEFLDAELKEWSEEKFDQLSEFHKNIHKKAFTTNVNNPDYRKITTVQYHDGDIIREAKVPQGDILHQFRSDVDNGKLPEISWLVAPENFSDHPTSPWYGAWYVSEVLDILTKNPEVWKKTIFILCYDENDGYFDHIPPFSVPNPYKENTGKVSEGIDPRVEYATLEQEMKKKSKEESRDSPIGLGYRVPLVIASPWNRGGKVFSEVSDHTSIIQFMETFIQAKTGKQVKEENISQWRRTICSDLTASFAPYDGEKVPLPKFLNRKEFMEGIHNAQFKKLPHGFKALNENEIKLVNEDPSKSKLMPKQESGIKTSCAIPYELYADGELLADKKAFKITFKSGNDIFGNSSSGSPFTVYSKHYSEDPDLAIRKYTVKAGDALDDEWFIDAFKNEDYALSVHGPNGFLREYTGNINSDIPTIRCKYQKDRKGNITGNILIELIANNPINKTKVKITDNAYKAKIQNITLPKAATSNVIESKIIELTKSFNWYDFTVTVEGNTHFSQRYAGHVETGNESKTDPFMGRVI